MWLTVAWLRQTEGPLAVAPGFIPTACTGFFNTYSLWVDTLLSLDIAERSLDLPPEPCALPSLRGGWDGLGRYLDGMEGGEGVGTWIGMYNEKLFSFLKIQKYL